MVGTIAFERLRLDVSLSGLDARLVGTFAMSCAQRIAPNLIGHLSSKNDYDTKLRLYEKCLQMGWRLATTVEANSEQSRSLLTEAEDEVPESNVASANGYPYAQDAALAICHGLRAFGPGGVAEAIWSAEAAYAVADHFAMRKEANLIVTSETEERAVRNSVVQNELSRQWRDVRVLQQAQPDPTTWTSTVATCRQRAVFEATIFFNENADGRFKQ